MKTLLISGGGSWGAWGGGFVSTLENDWDLVVGTSTGALLAPMVALGEYDILKKAYTQITPKSIFKTSPFKKNGKIHLLKALWRIISKKLSLGNTQPLLKTIQSFYTADIHKKLQDSQKQVVVTVFNATIGKVEFKALNSCSLLEAQMYLYASGAVPLLMDVVHFNGQQYVDGGVTDNIPFEYLTINNLLKDLERVDVIIHGIMNKPRGFKLESFSDMIMFLINAQRQEITDSDVSTVHEVSKHCDVNLYYLPYALEADFYIFDQKLMQKWWQLGESGQCEANTIKKNRQLKTILKQLKTSSMEG